MIVDAHSSIYNNDDLVEVVKLPAQGLLSFCFDFRSSLAAVVALFTSHQSTAPAWERPTLINVDHPTVGLSW